jgi:hypothetical protein
MIALLKNKKGREFRHGLLVDTNKKAVESFEVLHGFDFQCIGSAAEYPLCEWPPPVIQVQLYKKT